MQRTISPLLLAVVAVAAFASDGALAQGLSTAAPSPLFSTYQDLCLLNQGDPAKAYAAARAAGWTEPPPADLLPLGTLAMNDGRQLEKAIEKGRLHLAVGHASDPAQLGAGAAPWRVCVVSAEPADPAAAAALQRWAGVAATHDSDAASGSLLFLMSGAPGARKSADGLSEAQIRGLVNAHDIVAVGARTAGPFTILLYAAPGT